MLLANARCELALFSLAPSEDLFASSFFFSDQDANAGYSRPSAEPSSPRTTERVCWETEHLVNDEPSVRQGTFAPLYVELLIADDGFVNCKI